MTKTPFVFCFVICFFVSICTSVFCEINMNKPAERIKALTGYTNRRMSMPEDGMSAVEQKYLEVAIKINNELLSKERDMQIIAKHLVAICSTVWGDMTDQQLCFRLNTGQAPDKSKYIQHFTVLSGEYSFQFWVSGPNGANKEDMGGGVNALFVGSPEFGTKVMMCHFHPNGSLKELCYRNSDFAQVDVIKTWADEGVFVEEEKLKEPRPFSISK